MSKVFTMNHEGHANLDRDKAAGFTAALFLHLIVLCALWNYQIMPRQSEPMTLFVSLVNPVTPEKALPPQPVMQKSAALKPALARKEAPGPMTPVMPPGLTGPTPVTAPAKPVELPLPVVRQHSAASVASVASVASLPAVTPAVKAPAAVAGSSSLLLNNELSVSCTERTPPVYPKQSLRLGEQGKTVLLVELDELGMVSGVNIKTKSGFPRLDDAAISAVKTWRCTPARRNGAAVRSAALQPFNFTLKGR